MRTIQLATYPLSDVGSFIYFFHTLVCSVCALMGLFSNYLLTFVTVSFSLHSLVDNCPELTQIGGLELWVGSQTRTVVKFLTSGSHDWRRMRRREIEALTQNGPPIPWWMDDEDDDFDNDAGGDDRPY